MAAMSSRNISLESLRAGLSKYDSWIVEVLNNGETRHANYNKNPSSLSRYVILCLVLVRRERVRVSDQEAET
jgi:hypothetical protein